MKNLKVLVVDDEPAYLDGVTYLLQQAGCHVLQADTGEKALSIAEEHLPDIILLDYVLPDIDGMQICQRLKENEKTSSILVKIITGKRITSSDLTSGLEMGADDYLLRPVDNRELLARIKAMARLRLAEKEIERHRDQLEVLVEERTRELHSEIEKHKITEQKLIAERNKLKDALDHVKILTGLIPICLHCKKIRDDKGYWEQIETYIQHHSEATFSHAICPECADEHYPEYGLYDDKES